MLVCVNEVFESIDTLHLPLLLWNNRNTVATNKLPLDSYDVIAD